MTVAVVCAPVERERYVAVDTRTSNDVLTLAVVVFVFAFLVVPEERAVLVRVPAKLVECDVPEAPRAVPVLVAVCAVVPVACVSAPWVVPLLSSLSDRWCQMGVGLRGTWIRAWTHVCAAGAVALCLPCAAWCAPL